MPYADPERRREWDRAYRAANPERRLEAKRRYRVANQERIREARRGATHPGSRTHRTPGPGLRP